MTCGGTPTGDADTSPRGLTVVDRSFGERGGGYDLTEIRRTSGGHRLRARIHRDPYPPQSHALVEVLTPAMTWTALADEPPSAWHPATPYRSTSPTPLENLAERLFQRAAAILDAG
ncbi:hypothetical protein GA0070216_11594 [Micromonospora matsumotoense]|uniref:Uncharacterized protein n=1 Tax=Micromonospora matsumotoense TaxID=121616 RepID=A0A1C5ABK2_9ACTN|nr:hypothetical protein [Micromonospora matsumotoense]SCF42593.1 hypothetical protein GA0070216_11594 [Micromonospora matsumotoense]